MATKGGIDLFINALPTEIRYPLQQAFGYVMDNWRLGTGTRAENAQWYPFSVTTPAVANTEFSILHKIGVAPTWIIPVVDVSAVGSQLVPLQISKAADSQRVYLKSSSTSAVFTVLLEV